jgi:hypothetical protein
MHRRFLGLMGGLAAMIAVWWALSLLVPDGFIPAPDAVGLRFLVLFPGALAAHLLPCWSGTGARDSARGDRPAALPHLLKGNKRLQLDSGILGRYYSLATDKIGGTA